MPDAERSEAHDHRARSNDPSRTRAPLRFGVNYTPSREWMHSWPFLRPDDVRRDFATIAELGLDHVRVFPL